MNDRVYDTCSANGCTRDAVYVTKGLCRRHYGNLLVRKPVEPKPRVTPAERFARGFDRTEGC